jgi:hypothetical protein
VGLLFPIASAGLDGVGGPFLVGAPCVALVVSYDVVRIEQAVLPKIDAEARQIAYIKSLMSGIESMLKRRYQVSQFNYR